ncbi:MAG: cytochrome peroxidase [Verrucomicrobia bacterium]|jgi:cytochrome c peroxidase|nr:cytochrome peroxidase [Verrucomicrobiota bacterium]
MKPRTQQYERPAIVLWLWLLLGWLLVYSATSAEVPGKKLTVDMAVKFGGVSVEVDQLAITNLSGQSFSVTRADFLLSDFALRTTGGTWIERTNWQAFISLTGRRTRFEVSQIPAGQYDRIRFKVGLDPKLNHSDPAQYAPDHPLNPNLNGLHWGWQDGYVFLALEGRWRKESGDLGGYSFHLGNDAMLTTVDLALPLDLTQDQQLNAALHLNRLLGGRPALAFNEDTAVTHSREGDPLAMRLSSQLRHAFSFEAPVAARMPELVKAPPVSKRLMATNATPYRFAFARQFPPPKLPLDNPLTNEGVELGRKLFHEKRLSVNDSQSCASCHQATLAFAEERQFSLGAEGKTGTRNAMPLFNLAWKQTFFWDGRAPSLREQVLMPIQDPVEMHESLTNVVTKLAALETYPALFERAFGTKEIDSDRVARALEQFLLTIVSYRSKFDRAMQGREEFSEQEKRGFELFVTEYDPRRGFYGADCFHCHGGPMFTNHGFANNGLEEKAIDIGLGKVSRREFDTGRFAVPSLRNVALTAPYMHDGRFKTLEETVEHYASGVKPSASLDPNLAKHPKGGVPLSAADKKALVAFLQTLTDETFLPKQETNNRTKE